MDSADMERALLPALDDLVTVWERIAVVSDQKAVEWLTRGFSLDELAQASAWIVEA